MTLLFALLWAITPPAAVIDADGTVLVHDGQRWLAIDRCPDQRAQLAWVKGSLYIHCPGRPLFRWGRDGAARATRDPILARRRPALIAGGEDLYLVEAGALWRFRVGAGILERVSRLPAKVKWIRETADGVLVGDRDGWMWRGRRWVPVAAGMLKKVRWREDSDTLIE